MANGKPRSKAKKVCSITLSVLTYIFFAICLVALVLSVTAKRDPDGAVNIWGKQLRVVRSDSMAACDETDVSKYDIKDIPIKSVVFIELVPDEKEARDAWYADLEVGDVLTFKYVYVKQETITHRIVDKIENANGGYTIVLEGDNKSSDADTLTQSIDTSKVDSPNYIIGKVTSQSYPLGLLITAVRSSVGIICIIIIPCVIIAIFEILRIVNVLGEKKRTSEREENERRDAELEEMKRQLEILKKAAEASSPSENTNTEIEKTENTESEN